jgi:alpha-beta hydrolase superfamily lysophospholipase
MDSFTFASRDGTEVHCYRWQAASSPKGILQIAHGMGEHALRYAPLAALFTREGFHVYANDHRGHGRTARTPKALGDFGKDGWDGLVADMVTLTQRAKEEAPGLPLVLLGHSMGSFALQRYLLDHSTLIEAAALSGSVAFDKLFVDLERQVDLTSINAAFEPARTPFDWLSRDPAQVDLYVADPLCGFGASQDATRSMALSMRRTTDPVELSKIRKDLPIYVMAGDADPINGRLVNLKPVAERYRAAGIREVTERYYADGRHEMFNEVNRDEVMNDFLTWVRRVLPSD